MATNYIDNKKFEELIFKYIKTKDKAIEDELFLMFDRLIDNILFTFKFDLDSKDAKQECFLLILKILPNFSEDKGSAFNYFTTVIVNNMKLIYSKNKKYNKKLENYKEIRKDFISQNT